MKLRILVFAALIVTGLHFLNDYLNGTPRYRGDASSTGTPAGGVRQVFTVGFLPVT